MEVVMPNWNSNHLTVKGENEAVQRFREKAVGHCPWNPPVEKPNVLNFHSLVPVPADVLEAGYEAKGYDWELANWGCKWGACDGELIDDNGCELFYGFDTAWSPPIAFLAAAAKQWPMLTFILEYEEPGMGFKGLARFQGEQHEDHCIEF
jgi:Ferredoxin-like domain in Api92-like protein